jgi:hypothetical protein
MFAVSLLLFCPRITNFGLSKQSMSRYATHARLARSPSKAIPRTLPTTSLLDAEGDSALASIEAEGGDPIANVQQTNLEATGRRDGEERIIISARDRSRNDSGKRSKDSSRIPKADPSEVVKYNSKTKELLFNRTQREMLWESRRKEYQATLTSIAVTLQSHLSPAAKCNTLLLLHEERVIKRRLRLRQDTYDDIFHVISAVATSVENRANSRLTVPYLNEVWVVYRYMVDSGTEPSAKIVQFVMSVLELVRVKDVDVEARAHALMLDLDARSICPSPFTLNSYFCICGVNNVMHIAVARLSDARARFHIQPNASMCAVLLQGLVRNGQVKEAVKFIATLSSVSMTEPLLNRILDVMRKSGDPLSVFTVYRAVRSSQIPISAVTIHILVQAMIDAENNSELSFVLQEMKKYRVKGDPKLLNRLLAMMLAEGLTAQHAALMRTMERSGVRIFDECRGSEKSPLTVIPTASKV